MGAGATGGSRWINGGGGLGDRFCTAGVDVAVAETRFGDAVAVLGPLEGRETGVAITGLGRRTTRGVGVSAGLGSGVTVLLAMSRRRSESAGTVDDTAEGVGSNPALGSTVDAAMTVPWGLLGVGSRSAADGSTMNARSAVTPPATTIADTIGVKMPLR